MSWRDAPLYVECFDLVEWLAPKIVAMNSKENAWPFGADLGRAASDLFEAVPLALTFPAVRSESLERADHAVVRIRVWLRLAAKSGHLTERQLPFAAERLAAIGAMIGGWEKRLERRDGRERAPTAE